MSELADEHKISSALSSAAGHNHQQQQPLSSLDANYSTADLRIPVIENWLQQPATQTSVDAMQQFTDQQQAELKTDIQSLLNAAPAGSPRYIHNVVLASHLNSLQPSNPVERTEASLVQLSGQQQQTSRINLQLKSGQVKKLFILKIVTCVSKNNLAVSFSGRHIYRYCNTSNSLLCTLLGLYI